MSNKLKNLKDYNKEILSKGRRSSFPANVACDDCGEELWYEDYNTTCRPPSESKLFREPRHARRVYCPKCKKRDLINVVV